MKYIATNSIGLPSGQCFGRRFRAGLLVLALAATTIVALPRPAMAEPNFHVSCTYSSTKCQNGTEWTGSGGPPSVADKCEQGIRGTRVCIRYSGDYVYVYDGQKDGHSAIGEVDVHGGDLKICRNRHGYGSWARCNFDWNEARTKTVFGGYRKNYNTISVYTLWEFSGK